MKDLLLIIGLVVLGVLTRTTLHIAPNVEFVTASGIVAVYFLQNKKLSIVVPIVTMLLTDLLIGNTLIYLFTWSGFILVPFTAKAFQKLGKNLNKMPNKLNILLTTESAAIVSTLVFFLWTNLGVVLTTNMYERNLFGLFRSYINGIPFLGNQLLGNILITPILFASLVLITKISHKVGSQFNKLV